MRDGTETGFVNDAVTIAGLEIAVGELLVRSGQVDEASKCFERALEGDASLSDEARACLRLGMIRFDGDDHRGAEVYWNRSVAINDREYAPRSAMLLGQLLLQQRRLAEARSMCRFALESGHADAAANAALLMTSLGTATDEREFEIARAYVQRMLVSQDPDVRSRAAFATGLQLWDQRRYAEAEPMLLTGIAESKGAMREYARYILGVAYYEMRRYEEAVQILRTLVRSFGSINANGVAASVCYLASALIETGCVQEAADLWREYSEHTDPTIADPVRRLLTGTRRRLALANLTRDHWRVTYSRRREARSDGTSRLIYGGVVKVSTDGHTWTPFHRCQHRHSSIANARRCGTEWLNGWMADLAQEREGLLRAGWGLAHQSPN